MIDLVFTFDHVHVISKEPEASASSYTETRADRREAHGAQRRSDFVDLGGTLRLCATTAARGFHRQAYSPIPTLRP
jgi:hypothetical protein